MKNNRKHRIVSLILIVALLSQTLPTQIFAAAINLNSNVGQQEITTDAVEITPDIVTIVGEVDSLRTEEEKHFRLSDGSFIAVDYGMPVHYSDENGHWHDIDNSLVEVSAASGSTTYQIANEIATTAFAASLVQGQLFSTEYNGFAVSMSLLEPAQNSVVAGTVSSIAASFEEFIGTVQSFDCTATAELVETTESIFENANDSGWKMEDLIPENFQASLLYEDVFTDVDLRYTAYGYNIKEEIIVNAPQSSYNYYFNLELDGLTPRLNEDGSVSLLDSTNTVIYSIPAPFVEDSAGVTSYDAVSYSLLQKSGSAILSIQADTEWMNDSDRVYPIYIDPTLFLEIRSNSADSDGNIYGTYLIEGHPDEHQGNYRSMFCGYSSYTDSGTTAMYELYRILVQFNVLPNIPYGSVVDSAFFNLYMKSFSSNRCAEIPIGVYEVTGDKPTSTASYGNWLKNMTWNNQPAYDSENMLDYVITSADTTESYIAWDITELVKQWYAEGNPSSVKKRVIELIATNEAELTSSYCAWSKFLGYSTSTPPVLVVHYRDNIGIEPYYSYTTMDVGKAGVVYLADATGQLKIVNELFSYSSAINPFTLNLVYTSDYFSVNENASYYTTYNLGTSMCLGQGWTLDAIQKISTATHDDTNYLIYYDGDGTKHYFSQDTNRDETGNYYYDEDGLGLKIKLLSNNNYQLSDEDGNTWIFTDGLLSSQEDRNGNQIIYNYSNGKLISISQKNLGQEDVILATLTYSGNFLSRITDAAGNIYSFSYTNSDYYRLTQIFCNGRDIATYEYLSNSNRLSSVMESIPMYKVCFDWTAGKVSQYCNYGGAILGHTVKISYPNHSQTVYHDEGADRLFDSDDDLKTFYLFDYAGRTANIYTTDATGKVVGASNAAYTEANTTDRKNNRIIRTATIGIAAQNLLLGSDFENTNYNWTYSSGCNRTAAAARSGNFGLQGTLTAANDSVSAYRSCSLVAGETYTLSAQINTSNLTITGTGVYLKISSTTGNWTSLPISNQTVTTVNRGWIQASLTFTAVDTGVHNIHICATGAVGTFYVDELQLEKGDAPSSRNLLSNSDMNIIGQVWTMSGASFAANTGMDDSATIKMIGDTDNVCIAHQTITVAHPVTQTYVLSGWVKANALPDNDSYGRFCGLKAELAYSNGTTESFVSTINSNLTDWQFTSLVIVPQNAPESGTINTIKVTCAYAYNANTAHFDNISLIPQAAQTMKYDDDGNLTSISVNGITVKQNTFENGNLIEAVTNGNETYEYSYDAHNNLISVTDDLLTQSYVYKTTGATASTTVTGADGKKISTSAVYSNGDNLLYSMTDSLGNVVGYRYSGNYNVATARPSQIIDAKNNVTTLTYDAITDQTLSQTFGSNHSITYNYNDYGHLQSITRTSLNGGTAFTQNYYWKFNTFGYTTSITLGSATNDALAEYYYNSGAGTLESVVYANGNATHYTYDHLGRIIYISYTDLDLNGVRYVYNGNGDLYKVNDLQNNITSLYGYDELGRIISVLQYKDNSYLSCAYYTYDTSNKLIDYDYDSSELGSSGEEYHYSQNVADLSNGTLTSMRTTAGSVITYTYDSLMRISSKNIAGNIVENYTYVDSAGQGGNTSTLIATKTVLVNNNEVHDFHYTYDASGNIVECYDETNDLSYQYHYDAQDVLTEVLAEQNNSHYHYERYEYDAFGNVSYFDNGLIVRELAYHNDEWKDLLTQVNGATVTYDRIGNPTSYYNGMLMDWDGARQLAGFYTQEESCAYVYTYDANGSRISKKRDNIEVVNYLVVNGVTLGERNYDTNGTYLYSLRYIFDENGSVCGYSYIAAEDTCWTDYYFVKNLQGDVTEVYRATDNLLVAQYEYDAWGGARTANGLHVSINPFRYRGYYYDSETGFYYVSSRYYDPEIGRWINADALVDQSSVLGYNLFAYCRNNPVNMTDTTGNLPFFAITAAIGAVVGAVVGGVVAAKNGGNIWAGVGIGAAAGALIGTGAGMAAGAALAGSITATTGAVMAGGSTLVATVGTGGLGAGATYIANNLSQAANNLAPAAQTAASKMQEVATKGKAGEALSGLAKNTSHIPSLTGTASYRIPDGLDAGMRILSEVKNYSGTLSYTNQLKDFVMWSQANGYQMHLYTNATLTGPLQQVVDSGIIQLFPLR